jgi:hypothetical protein
MNPLLMIATAGTALLLATAGMAETTTPSEDEVMQRLDGVAPAPILQEASLVHVGEDMSMHTVREGTNDWTCVDMAGSPMCADPAGMEWLEALMNQGDAPQRLGFVYMLLGDEGASNTDPLAMEETPDNNWVVTGPHVMVVGAEGRSLYETYPREAEADPSRPYVMWPDTPYEHLMLPVE